MIFPVEQLWEAVLAARGCCGAAALRVAAEEQRAPCGSYPTMAVAPISQTMGLVWDDGKISVSVRVIRM